jgi:hypothetical protein
MGPCISAVLGLLRPLRVSPKTMSLVLCSECCARTKAQAVRSMVEAVKVLDLTAGRVRSDSKVVSAEGTYPHGMRGKVEAWAPSR